MHILRLNKVSLVAPGRSALHDRIPREAPIPRQEQRLRHPSRGVAVVGAEQFDHFISLVGAFCGIPLVFGDDNSSGAAGVTGLFTRLEGAEAGGGTMYDDRRHCIYTTTPPHTEGDLGPAYEYDVLEIMQSLFVDRVRLDPGVGGGGWTMADREDANRDGEDNEEALSDPSSGDEWEKS